MTAKQSINQTIADKRNERGQNTRKQLLKTALELFGEYGFEGTSTRQIAMKAGCNLGLISFHFGSKQKLYDDVRACIIDELAEGSKHMTSKLKEIDVSRMHGPELRSTVYEFVNQLLGILIKHAGDKAYFMMLRRCMQAGDAGSKEILDEIFIPPFRETVRILNLKNGEKSSRLNELKAFMALETAFCFIRDYPFLSIGSGHPVDIKSDNALLSGIICGILEAD